MVWAIWSYGYDMIKYQEIRYGNMIILWSLWFYQDMVKWLWVTSPYPWWISHQWSVASRTVGTFTSQSFACLILTHSRLVGIPPVLVLIITYHQPLTTVPGQWGAEAQLWTPRAGLCTKIRALITTVARGAGKGITTVATVGQQAENQL